MKAEIILTYRVVEEAEAVADAVSPDNAKAPPGLYVRTTRKKNEVLTQIDCKTRLQTFISTIDDLLACVSVAEKAFSTVKDKKLRII